MRSSLIALALLVMTAPSRAGDVRLPDRALSPAEVVEIQLVALQANDTPESDAGIAQTWAFAHPDNKRMTGPLPRFASMIKGPLYRILLNHRSHDVEQISRTDVEAAFAVTVTSQMGEVCCLPMERRDGRRWRGRGRVDDQRSFSASARWRSHLIWQSSKPGPCRSKFEKACPRSTTCCVDESASGSRPRHIERPRGPIRIAPLGLALDDEGVARDGAAVEQADKPQVNHTHCLQIH